ncbi:S1C family serine protease [Rhodococcus phenolicus]|uniref:S1C family serine protease n=1 Tax=Rhodococcus phenolicus TaxID=263849 RepID=UPI00082A182F|nr:trypsin-like peptidase domain-containing protein [Rhodococcus phenolicus]
MSARWAATLVLGFATAASLALSAPAVVETVVPPPPPPVAAEPPTAEELAARIVPAVVTLTATDGWTGVAGTGIVLTPDGLVLTNHHVVSGADEITAVSAATGLSYDVAVNGYDRAHDIAVVQLGSAQDLPVATLADTNPLLVGTAVTAFGNADGGGVVVAAPGTIVATGRNVVVRDSADGSRHRLTGMLQSDAAIRPGDSGGPLVDEFGAVVGVNTAGAVGEDPADTATAPEAYAVPISAAMRVVDQIRSGTSGGTVHVGATPLLGVTVTTVREDGENRGAEVLWVSFDSPADAAGLDIGDVITSFDGKPVGSHGDLETLLMAHAPGDSVRIGWHDRTGAPQTASVTVEAGPAR